MNEHLLNLRLFTNELGLSLSAGIEEAWFTSPLLSSRSQFLEPVLSQSETDINRACKRQYHGCQGD